MLRAVAGPHFTDLGPDAALEAVEAAGLRPTGHCSMLRCLENRVWDLRLDDGAHVVVKFYRPGRWSRAGIEDEHRFLLDLREAEIPVCAPLTLQGGGTIGEHAGISFGVWPRTGGREPDELSDEELAILGRLLARIHDVGARRRPQDRPSFDADTVLIDPLDELLERKWLPDHCEDRFVDAVETLADAYAAGIDDLPFLRVHGDCHLGNLLRGREGWFFLDFDDFGFGPAIHDLWVLVPGRDPEAARQREAVLAGYRLFRPFESRWLGLIEPLRAARMLKISSWVARRWDEPAFRSTFPHFGTDLYWERETRDLEEIAARLDALE
jgi:Ser/Thr protein kinase RdoA (MazF antagonist)